MNSVQLLGNLTREPDVRFTNSGMAYARFSVACNQTYNDHGQAKQRADFVPCVAWGKIAEQIGNTLRKGSQVFVEGRFTTRSWEKDGQKHYMSEVNVNHVSRCITEQVSQNQTPQPAAPGQGFNDMGQQDNDEEIPF